MRFVDNDHDAPSPLMLFSGEQRLSLCDQVRLLRARLGAQGVDDGQVQTMRSEGWGGEVDDMVGGRVQLIGGSAHGDGLADADLASDDAEERLADTKADTCDGFLVAGAIA